MIAAQKADRPDFRNGPFFAERMDHGEERMGLGKEKRGISGRRAPRSFLRKALLSLRGLC